MYLEDTLYACLQAVSSRYPQHAIDWNVEIGVHPLLDRDGWKVDEIVDALSSEAPEVLRHMAHLIIESGKSVIYLRNVSSETLLFIIHCQGKIPLCHEQRRASQRQLRYAVM